MPLPVALRAFRSRNYRLFVGGQLVSLIGTWMQSVAQSWLIYRLTGSAALLGLIGFAGQIPIFILAPFGGVVADRRNRHRILIATQTIMMLLALALAALTLERSVRVWHIFLLASLLGIANAFDIPARQAFLVEMVGKEDIVNAIALSSSMMNGARIVGPAVAGMVVAAVGEGWCFLLNAISYVAVIVALLLMKIAPRRDVHPRVSTWHSVVEGFSFAWHTRPIRALLLLLGLVSVMGMPYAVLMPIIADRTLHGGPNEIKMDLPQQGEPGYGLAHTVLTLGGISLRDVQASLSGTDLTVSIAGTSDSITIRNYQAGRVTFVFDDRARGNGMMATRQLPTG